MLELNKYQIIMLFNLVISMQMIILLFASNCGQVSSSVSVANVNQVEIIGFEKQVLNRQLNVFLGIPYAQPPVGDQRFQKPKPVKLSAGQRVDATEWPQPCWQVDNPEFVNLVNRNFSEDCLYLNIWSPNQLSNKQSGVLKPVLFWIHGGGLCNGSASDFSYEGDILAALADVVVVSINYRLNVFGFLFADNEEIPGNMGFYDQILAIEWVQNNIKFFGGDPDKVTIIGQSAGGWSVSGHFLSPLTRNLFNNAVALSGSLLPPCSTLRDRKTARDMSLAVAKKVGCAEKSAVDFSDSKIINCLKQIEPSRFYQIGGNEVVDFEVIIWGDEFLPRHPIEMLESGDFKSESQLIIGTIDDEGKTTYYNRSLINSPSFDKKQAIKVVRGSELFQSFDVDNLIKFYLSTISDANKKNALRKAVTRAGGDKELACPTINFGRLVYKNDPSNRVYEYHYTYKHDYQLLKELRWTLLGRCEPYQDACHTQDLVSVFGWPFQLPERFSKKEKQLSKRMIQTLASFSRTGRPAKINGVEWPPFYKVNGKTAMPYYKFASKDRPEGNFGWNLRQFECQALLVDKKLISLNKTFIIF